MSNTDPGIASGEPSLFDRAVAVAVITGSALGLAACSPRETQPDDIATPPAVENIEPQIPRGLCIPAPFDSRELRVTAAKRCLPALQNGKVALVAFRGAEVTPAMGDYVHDVVKRATSGVVNVTVTIVPASQKAEDKLATRLNGKSCIDSKNPDMYASTAADETMTDELADENFVIGMTNRFACTKSVGGVADSGWGRDADVFMAGYVDRDHDGDRVHEVASTISHELLHLYQLGHAGRIWGQQPDGSWAPLKGSSQGGEHAIGQPLDLKAYLATCRYGEYDDGTDIMGNTPVSILANLEPNPLHVDYLLQTEVTLGEAAPLAQQVNGEWLRYDANATSAGNFATVKLEEPTSFKDDSAARATDNGVVEHAFDTIAFVPQLDPGYGIVYGVGIYLYDSNSQTSALIGIMAGPSSGTRTSRVSYGSQVFEVQSDGKAVQVRTAPAA